MAAPKAQNKYSVQEILNRSYDEDYKVVVTLPYTLDPTTELTDVAMPANPLNLKPYDYASRDLNSATETWTFKSGGSDGTITNTVVIVYTDDTLSYISTVTKT